MAAVKIRDIGCPSLSARPCATDTSAGLLFGGGGLWYLFVCLAGAVAFRADEQGIALGNSPLGRGKHLLHVPWSSIAEVVLFRQDTGPTTMPYVGLRLRPDAPSAPTGVDRGGVMGRINRGLVPHVPEDVLRRSRPINGWRLDEEKLAQTLAIYAPQAPIVRL